MDLSSSNKTYGLCLVGLSIINPWAALALHGALHLINETPKELPKKRTKNIRRNKSTKTKKRPKKPKKNVVRKKSTKAKGGVRKAKKRLKPIKIAVRRLR